jgi:MFS family permease
MIKKTTPSLSKQERKIVTLAALGGMLEFYDFIIYGIFSIYFAHQFFPGKNEAIIIIQSYVIFVLGYIARPIGGVFFSHIGDEYGRKNVLIITIILMGAASLGIGCLPTYAQIGVAAPILLLLFRLLQGLALGGELPSTFVYIFEKIPDKKGLAFGITMSGVNGGLLLGMLINSGLNHFLTAEQLTDFGWRFPFVFGGIICLVSYNIRKKLQETTAFQKIHDKPKLPFVYLLRHHFLNFFAGTAIVSFMAASVVVAIVFMPTYLHEFLKIDSQKISYVMTAIMITNVLVIYFTGLITEYYTPFVMLKTLLLLCCFLIPVSYLLLSGAHIGIALVILGVLEGAAATIVPYILTSIFESKIRLTGVALSYNIGFTLFGGLSPLVITNTIRMGYNVYLTPCIYLLVIIAICAIGYTTIAHFKILKSQVAN